MLNFSVDVRDRPADSFAIEPCGVAVSEFQGLTVPETLRSGNHPRVSQWRLAMAIARTARLRPDLLEQRGVSREELALLDEFNISIADRFVSE